MDDRYLRYLREGNFNQFIADDEPETTAATQPVTPTAAVPPTEPAPVETAPVTETPTEPAEPTPEPETTTASGSETLTPEESQQVEVAIENDQTVVSEPLNAQAVINQEVTANGGKPTTDRELITDVFGKIGWDKYIKQTGDANANR